MRNSTHQVVEHPLGKKGDGLFLPSCFLHGTLYTETKLSGFSALEGLGDWFFGRGKVPRVLVDNCKMQDGLPCNPTCPGAPPGPGPAPGPTPPGPGPAPGPTPQITCGSCGSTLLRDTTLAYHDIDVHVVANETACCALCAKNLKCAQWAWHGSQDQTCHLHAANSFMHSQKGTISGVMNRTLPGA